MAKTNKYSIINNEMFLYELNPDVIENVPQNVTVIYVQEEKYSEFKQLNPSLPLAKKNFLLMGIHQPEWYEDYQRVMQLPDIASPELSFTFTEVEQGVYEVPCTVSLAAVNNPHSVEGIVYSVDGVEVQNPNEVEISTIGAHTVTASFSGSELYYAASVSYTLNIVIVYDTMSLSFANNEVSVSSYLDETWTGQLQPVIGAPAGSTIVYSCENGTISNGELTLPSAGTYLVEVSVSCPHYYTATASYDIVYTQDYRTMNVSFETDSVGVSGNQKEAWTGTVQAVTGAPANSSIVYSCNDQNVTISGINITIADEGTYTISATISAQYYTSTTISYNIVYSQQDLVMNLSFANSAISETLTEGDGYESQLQAVTGAPQNSTIVYSTSTGSISDGVLTLSNISDGDSVTVSATVSCPDYVTTTISYTISFTVLSIMDAYFANDVDVNTYVDETYIGALQAVTDAPSGATITYSCENGTIANGQITLSSAGTYTVYAEISCSGYVTKTISYSIVYTKNNRTMSVSFANSSVSVDSYMDENYSGTLQAVTGAPQNSTVTYSCSANEVSISGTSVSITTAGTYTISAVVSCQYYNDTTITYSIVYTKNNRTMNISVDNAFVDIYTYVDENYSGALQSVNGAPQGATINYSCKGADGLECTINNTSSVHLYGAGRYTVRIEVYANGYDTGIITYTITYIKRKRTMSVSFDNASVSVSSYSDENYSGTLQAVSGAPQNSTVTYSCSDNAVTISGTSVSISATGSYTITAVVSAQYYNDATITYTIVYTKNNRTMSISFSNATVTESISSGESYSGTLQAVTGAPQEATIVYSCSDNEVTISGTSVSISATGSYTITATVSKSGYTTATASYTLVIEEIASAEPYAYFPLNTQSATVSDYRSSYVGLQMPAYSYFTPMAINHSISDTNGNGLAWPVVSDGNSGYQTLTDGHTTPVIVTAQLTNDNYDTIDTVSGYELDITYPSNMPVAYFVNMQVDTAITDYTSEYIGMDMPICTNFTPDSYSWTLSTDMEQTNILNWTVESDGQGGYQVLSDGSTTEYYVYCSVSDGQGNTYPTRMPYHQYIIYGSSEPYIDWGLTEESVTLSDYTQEYINLPVPSLMNSEASVDNWSYQLYDENNNELQWTIVVDENNIPRTFADGTTTTVYVYVTAEDYQGMTIASSSEPYTIYITYGGGQEDAPL